jgi:hypothetical protein
MTAGSAAMMLTGGHCIAPTSIGCHFDPIAAGATAMTEAAGHHSCRYLLVPQRL